MLRELFAAGAPFTVQAFNRLVDRRYFDGLAWYRVVPGALAEGGDRRGDGLAGDGQTIRDEQSPRGFGRGAVGLVLAGPDTGESRFFIAQSPQLGFQGTHTVFAQVVSGLEVLDRLTLGDRIRRVRRQ
jgi:cyclophilin family peptidyl-prolyl cis-trans isomerase